VYITERLDVPNDRSVRCICPSPAFGHPDQSDAQTVLEWHDPGFRDSRIALW